MRSVSFSIILLFVSWCQMVLGANKITEVDQLNAQAYTYRYSDISYSQQCAYKAYLLSKEYPDGKAEALNHLAYVAYQQMKFDNVKHYVKDIYRDSRNQIELLCADVISMKVAQRVGDGNDFFDYRHQALHRIKRINEDLRFLTERQTKRFMYACTEMHIISSTYYYYLGQDSASISEIELAGEDIKLEQDTTQWLYYHYMLGSGGLIEGDKNDVHLEEFDHLFKAYTLAKANGIIYFEANTLQSMASMLIDKKYALLIESIRPDAFYYLKNQYSKSSSVILQDSTYHLPLALAEHALYLFKQYKDLYQTACAYRTIGEIYFQTQDYEMALFCYKRALSLVTSQRSRSSETVLPWMATIHERLSMAYSALGNKHMSDYHRNNYLDLLDNSRQDKELYSRKEILGQEITSIRIKLLLLCILFTIVLILAIAYMFKLKHKTISHLSRALNIRESETYIATKEEVDKLLSELADEKDELADDYQVNCHKIDNYKQGNVERRAKVALVYAIIPYLDRMLADANKMSESGIPDQGKLQYINELSAEIIRLNDILTEWIKMQKGQVQLHVSSFSLQSILNIVALNQHAFAEKGLSLNVAECTTLVKADESLTLFMINTLADNARKFTQPGGSVTIDVQETERYAEISIIDTGIGLSEADVETLNNSKVYDSSHLGLDKDNKGFGFGIMNCKGIINNYKKIASIFEICDFGVESTLGKGSRFWFRVPRIITMVVMLLCFSFSHAQNQRCYGLYQALYQANIDGRYAEGYAYGDSALRIMEEPFDTALLISLHNEMAISALALEQWEEYKYNNQACVHLHQLYSQDPTLASDCLRMQKIKSDSNMLYVILLILAFVAIILFYQLFIRGKINRGRSYRSLMENFDNTLHLLMQHVAMTKTTRCDDPDNTLSLNTSFISTIAQSRESANCIIKNDQSLRDLVNDFYDEVVNQVNLIASCEDAIHDEAERCHKTKFESDRLYVMNQILDNSLSTIKHETMYYPSRAQVMVNSMLTEEATPESLTELYQLLCYYREVYLLLYEQASRQLSNNDFHRNKVAIADIFANVEKGVANYNTRNNQSVELECQVTDTVIFADKSLIDVYVRQMLHAALPDATKVITSANQDGNMVLISFSFIGVSKTEEELQQLFTPSSNRIPYLVMRQIIREHDAQLSHPGLRLYADSCSGGFRINVTMKTTNKI